jgi:hypothetical protein
MSHSIPYSFRLATVSRIVTAEADGIHVYPGAVNGLTALKRDMAAASDVPPPPDQHKLVAPRHTDDAASLADINPSNLTLLDELPPPKPTVAAGELRQSVQTLLDGMSVEQLENLKQLIDLTLKVASSEAA